MQDNNWTDDGQFYDEAWAKMATQLDALPRRRRSSPWWSILPLLLLGIGLAWWMIYSTQPVEMIGSPIGKPTASSAEVPFNKTEEALPQVPKNGKQQLATDLSMSSTPQLVEAQTLRTKTGNEGQQTGQVNRTLKRFGKSSDLTPAWDIDLAKSDLERPMGDGNAIAQNEHNHSLGGEPAVLDSSPKIKDFSPASTSLQDISPTMLTTSPVTTSVATPQTGASILIDPAAPLPVKLRSSLTLPVTTPFKSKTTTNLFVEAGVTSATSFDNLGYTLGGGVRLNTAGRWSFPITLEYRYDPEQIKDLSFEEAEAMDVTVTSPPVISVEAVSQNVLEDLEANELALLKTQSIGLQLGAQYRVGGRLSISAGLGLDYRLVASGPLVQDPSGNVLLDLRYDGSGVGDVFSERITQGSNTNFSALDQGITNPEINRFAVTSSARLLYRIANRLDTYLAVRHAPRDFAKDNSYQISPTRFGVGLRYRLR
ncbi:outer membrane protein [Lewinella sp. 4G2]|uniref:outer membrane protein n=1 Tax=Lewinella sp. 4G2 TaxID=1803372 RepID=UPI0007B4D36A|nr:hypothetical protein [Lewinella sp. 4G2]OAV45551.1 hypothetical protein A3850_014080 [Lewinella sp. 4G2]